MNLEGVRAVITGGSLGLGKAISTQFVGQGADIAICARDAHELERTTAELRALSAARTVFPGQCDVSDEGQVAAFITAAEIAIGPINVLVANAGVYGPMGPTELVDLHEWTRALEINLLGVLLPCRAVIPLMKARQVGKIIVVSGGGATSPLPNITSYAASKAAAIRLMESLAEELRDHGIDVNAIAPGALATRLVDQVLAAGPEQVGSSFYQKNVQWKAGAATPMDLGARLAAYLASTASDGITGKLISAQWDPWESLDEHRADLERTDIYCLRRIVPADRGLTWGG